MRLWLDSKLILCILAVFLNETMTYDASIYISTSQGKCLASGKRKINFSHVHAFVDTWELTAVKKNNTCYLSIASVNISVC